MTDFLFCFLLGGAGYVLIELLWRGRSHFSMFIAGGFAFALLHALFQRYALPLPVKCIVGALVITAIEFIAGYIVNLRMGLNVWDYSGRPYNLYRQICPGFALLWALLSLPIALLCDHIK